MIAVKQGPSAPRARPRARSCPARLDGPTCSKRPRTPGDEASGGRRERRDSGAHPAPLLPSVLKTTDPKNRYIMNNQSNRYRMTMPSVDSRKNIDIPRACIIGCLHYPRCLLHRDVVSHFVVERMSRPRIRSRIRTSHAKFCRRALVALHREERLCVAGPATTLAWSRPAAKVVWRRGRASVPKKLSQILGMTSSSRGSGRVSLTISRRSSAWRIAVPVSTFAAKTSACLRLHGREKDYADARQHRRFSDHHVFLLTANRTIDAAITGGGVQISIRVYFQCRPLTLIIIV